MDPKQRKLAFEFNAPWLPYNITLSYFISFGKLMYRLAEAIYFSLYFLGQPSIMIFMIYEVFPFSVCVRSYIHNISNLKILSSSLQFLTGSTFCCYSFSLMYCKARTLAGGLIFFWEEISNIYSNFKVDEWAKFEYLKTAHSLHSLLAGKNRVWQSGQHKSLSLRCTVH